MSKLLENINGICELIAEKVLMLDMAYQVRKLLL